MIGRLALVLTFALLDGCKDNGERTGFPDADRPVATITSNRFSTEEARDRVNEANRIMDLAELSPGMTVADIGAGEGYYTIRLSKRVGENGRVLAQDIVPATRDALAVRVEKDKLDNVSVKLGEPANPMLPIGSFDRVFMVHMYHEIELPYEFLWNLRPSLKPGGRVVVVDTDRPTKDHGTPPALLRCEFAAIGYEEVAYRAMPNIGGYFMMFEAEGERPEPRMIQPCVQGQPTT